MSYSTKIYPKGKDLIVAEVDDNNFWALEPVDED